MAFNLHFGNTWKQKYFQTGVSKLENTCFSYREKIGNLSPALCFQADVLYPNALASVSSEAGLNTAIAVGCVGNQIDNKFPLEPRVPICLPLVQYPSSTRGESLEEMDMCGKPVLNWEKHIKELRRILHVPLGFMNPKFKSNKQCYKSTAPKSRESPESDDDDTPLNQRLILKNARKAIAERKAMSKKKSKVTSKSKIIDEDDPKDNKINEKVPLKSPFIPPEAEKTLKKKVVNDDDIYEIPVSDDDMPLLQRLWEANTDSEVSRVAARKKRTRDERLKRRKERKKNEDNPEKGKNIDSHKEKDKDKSEDGRKENQNEDDPKENNESEKMNNDSVIAAENASVVEDSIFDDTASDITQSTVDIKQKKISRYTQRKLAGKNREGPKQLFKKYLFEEMYDLEETNAEKRKRVKERKINGPQEVKFRKPDVQLPPIKVIPRDRLPFYAIRKYKSIPELRLQATWNYLYAGLSGACSTMEGMSDPTLRSVFVGCGTQLRTVFLKPAPKKAMLSYKVDSVWEEDKDKVPTNIRPGRNEPFSDLIYQIVPDQKNGFVAVRRGKSVEIYDAVEQPNLVCSIPNICFGQRRYVGWRFKRFVKDPLLYSVDINPTYSSEILTMDENLVVHLLIFPEERVLASYHANREHLLKQDYIRPYRDYPNLKINNTAGAAYLNTNAFFEWVDCCIHLHDRRLHHMKIESVQKLFDLRRSSASLSWSDQLHYLEKNPALNEFVSSVKKSQNPFYYYVGTTSRIFMMDCRVPDHPVMKMNHGMKSAATYIETYNDGNYEVLVAGSQRTHETFCLVTDHAHVACFERPECKARNPIMQSYPMHLSNSREFYKELQAHQIINSWPSDIKRSRDHNYAWTTGLAICKAPKVNDPEKPPGISVFTGNHYGDVFYQEWEQGPVEKTRKTFRDDAKLKNFFCKWRDSMETQPEDYDELNKESLNPKNPVDVSLLAKTAADSIPFMTRIRNKKFDIFKPDAIQHYKVSRNTPLLSDQVYRFRRIRFRDGTSSRTSGKSSAAMRILNVWGDDWHYKDICIDSDKQKDQVPGERDILGRYFEPVDLSELPQRVENEEEEEEQSPPDILGLNNDSMDGALEDGMLTEQQNKVLSEMKEEMEDYYIDDSDIVICDSDADINSSEGEANIYDDEEVNNSNSATKTKQEMSENAQQFSTQDFDELGFPGLGEFYPVTNVPTHILPDDGVDDEYPPSRPPSQGFQTLDMDEDLYTQSRPPSRPPSQGFQTLDMDEDLYAQSRPSSRPPSQSFQTLDMDDDLYSQSRPPSRPPSRPSSQGVQKVDMDDDLYSQSRPPSRAPSLGFQSIDMDDMNFGSSQNAMYTQELFSSQPTSQQNLFDPNYGHADEENEYKYSPYTYDPSDTGPGTSRSSLRPSSSSQQSQKFVKKPGF